MRSTMKAVDRRRAIAAAACVAVAVAAAFALHWSRPEPGVPAESRPVMREAAIEAQPAPPPEPTPSADGLKLYGLLSRGAVIGGAGVGQRFVPIGREVVPGLTLREVRQHQAILVHSAGTVTLTLDGRTTEARAAAESEPARAAGDRADRSREERLRYRLGFAPRRAGGRITGFVLRREADLPLLRRAGLRPGDVLVSVNGQSFDSEERVDELASEIAGSFTAEFEFQRGGRRMRTSLEVNPRP